jgi:hypothetical protein
MPLHKLLPMRIRIVPMIVAAAVLSGCGSSESSSNSEKTAECVEPANPWNDDGGHQAGFRWAEENGLECPNNHGESFEEGCSEFYNQRNRYEACEAAKRK